ncbi:hypothetical protein F2Q70_00044051 [Brassica cretica]|uniref:Uncharacterized protein n=1 Tax=Brassica cretica TaxID=69181 RepID=A0A8S9KIY0_BRACR|nr:hypothetical protein F2Q70_00044051 [Brassica cretica]KAF3519143.1 hypothetical protein DY000_02061659 [Brassica cretica]
MPSVFFWFTPTSLFEGFCRSRCASSSRRHVFVVEVFSVSGLGCLQLGSLSSSFVSPAIYGGSAWSLFKGFSVRYSVLSLSVEDAPEVVTTSGPLALYGLSVQRVYMVPVLRFGGGNL